MSQAKFLLIAALFISCPAFTQTLAPGDPEAIGKTFLTPPAGHPVRISDFRGKVAFINFWGNWCPPCTNEMKSIHDLQALLKDYRGQVSFIFISARQQAFKDDVEWLKQHDIAGENYQWEPRFPEQRFAFFGALPEQSRFAVPTTFVLDREGAVVERVKAPADWTMHLGTFLKLLAERRYLTSLGIPSAAPEPRSRLPD